MQTPSLVRSLHTWSVAGFATAVLLAGIVALATPVSAQSVARADIGFSFVAAGKEFPAGTYEFEVTAPGIVLRPQGGKMAPVVMAVITRLGRHDTDTDTELIFDKVDGQLRLSEVWLGTSDGYLVLNTPVDHEHRVLGGSKPHK
jgi:hypothetical protein